MTSDTVMIIGVLATFVIIGFLIIAVFMNPKNSSGFVIIPFANAVVVNSTADVKVPLQVTVGGQESRGTAAAPATAIDATSLTGLVGLGSALVYRWIKSDKHEEKFDARTSVGVNTQAQTAESLKSTDKGIEELLGGLSTAVGLIPGVPDEAKKIITDQLNGWKKDNEAYYVNTPAKPTDISKDPVVKKLGEIQKITEKNG
jgi:hypothetical protein